MHIENSWFYVAWLMIVVVVTVIMKECDIQSIYEYLALYWTAL